MHLLPKLLMPEPPAQKSPRQPPSPNLSLLVPTRRGSPIIRSRRSPTPTGKDKKESKKEKEGKSAAPSYSSPKVTPGSEVAMDDDVD